MTESHAVISRLCTEFAAMSEQLTRVTGQLTELDTLLTTERATAAQRVPSPPAPEPVAPPQPVTPQPVTPQPVAPQPPPVPATAPSYPYPQVPHGYWPPQAPPPYRHTPPPPRPPQPPVARPRRSIDGNWIGKVLAVAGVGVTLIGVVMLLVLAAQAGILRPEIRVGAGAVLAAALVAVGVRMHSRPGGRVGAIALAATGVAAAYMDVIAVTTIYDWVAAPVGLVVAAAVGGGGLTLARRWDAQALALLVLVPLIVLAPIVTDGITLLLIGFMLALSAATLPVQLGKDWIWTLAARTVAVWLPLMLAMVITQVDGGGDDYLLAGATGIAAVLSIAGALILLPRSRFRVPIALLTVMGVVPVLAAGLVVDHRVAAMMAAALALAFLSIVLVAFRLPGVAGPVAQIWSALAGVSALVGVLLAFDGEVIGPVLLGMAVVVGVAGRTQVMARCVAGCYAGLGAIFYLVQAPPSILVDATERPVPVAVSTLIASVLLVAAVVVPAWAWAGRGAGDARRALWAGAGVVVVYAVTTFTVTAGVLAGGVDGGFLAGHMAATICWIAMAAVLFVYAARVGDRTARPLPIAGGLALTAAALAKLFLFDLGTLDGMFRVAAFIVVGLVLLGTGAGYARILVGQDQSRQT